MENFGVSVGSRELNQDCAVTLSFGTHYGLLGKNGTGEITFLGVERFQLQKGEACLTALQEYWEFGTAEKKPTEELNKVSVSQKLEQIYKRIEFMMQIQQSYRQLPFLRSVVTLLSGS
ncbi:hypothetical protein MKW92_047604 [Papaver armeniacum]|nr:hypothetical protein MKW92_047604 [Papaver armeniacum]